MGYDGGASDDLNQIPQYFQKYLGPFWQQGINSMGLYSNALRGLIAHPGQLENQIMSGYQESPYAKFQTNQITDQVNRAAAAGGQLGTPNAQYDMAGKIQGVVSGDEQQYMQNAMQPYMSALGGLGGLVGMGEQAGQGIAGMYGDLYSNKANMDYMDNYQMNQLLGGLMGMGGNFLMNKFM